MELDKSMKMEKKTEKLRNKNGEIWRKKTEKSGYKIVKREENDGENVKKKK